MKAPTEGKGDPQGRIRVLQDLDELATCLAQNLRDLSTNVEHEPISVALSGGQTPQALYLKLAEPPFLQSVNWSRLHFYFGDERAVPPDHADSNFGTAMKLLPRPIVERMTFRMEAEKERASEYEALLRTQISRQRDGVPILDMILLGVGSDGHTASLFPGTKALNESRKLVVMNEVPERGTKRMTFTYPLINAADRVWIMVSGTAKQNIVQKVASLEDGKERSKARMQYPILGVRPDEGELVWFLDQAAAASND